MGRPAKLTDETVKTIVDAIKAGCPIAVACQAAGIGKTTFKSWMARGKSTDGADAHYRAFRADIRKARAHGEAQALGIIRDAMPDHWQAAAWFLERSRPCRWGRVDRLKAVQASGSGDDLRISMKYMTDAELEAIAEGKASATMAGNSYSGKLSCNR